MSKIIICLLLLFNIYICEEPPKNIRVFEKNSKENKITVRLGEEFVLKFVNNPGFRYSWRFLNEDETKDTIKFLRSYDGELYGRLNILGGAMNVYFQFKAIKKTKEPVALKYYYGRFMSDDKMPSFTYFKITVQ